MPCVSTRDITLVRSKCAILNSLEDLNHRNVVQAITQCIAVFVIQPTCYTQYGIHFVRAVNFRCSES